jgi:hypothetical protein
VPDGIPVRTVMMSRDIRSWRDLLTVAQLVRLFKEGHFNIVHTHVKPRLLWRLAARLAWTDPSPFLAAFARCPEFEDSLAPP